MAHTGPDWGLASSLKTVYRTDDLGELAARLGSIVTFDRRGDLVWYDGFEDGIQKWNSITIGTGAAVAQSNDTARNGGYSCKMTTGNATGNYTAIMRLLPLATISQIGVELSLTLHGQVDQVRLYWDIRISGTLYRPMIRMIQDNGVWNLQYRNSSNDWADIITDQNYYEDTNLFHTLKLVIDLDNLEYERVIFDNNTYVLSENGLYSEATVVADMMQHMLYVYTAVDANTTIYVDDVIVTQNEP